MRIPDIEFPAFDKITRFKRDIVVTEKLDGTNGQIFIDASGEVFAGSRNRWIVPGKSTDNYGFAGWVERHADTLRDALGEGHHYGEWWGNGIQRGYGLDEKRFSLFNVGRWQAAELPDILSLVPVIYHGSMDTDEIDGSIHYLAEHGSVAAPGFMDPEGIVIFLTQARTLHKITLDHNDEHKWKIAA